MSEDAPQENADSVLRYAHLLLADHLISTLYTISFGISWYVDNPHDGQRIANSEAQKEVSLCIAWPEYDS